MRPKYLIGTLFEQQEIDKKTNANNIKNKDPMGNTRWQGAFTGGFMAGYKNTCGSKEGFQPAQFVSSISKRAEKKQKNVIDYMDKEDLGRQSISSNIQVNKSFSSQGKNPFNIVLQQSIGQKILNKLKKQSAYQSAPQNQQDLDKLLKYYQNQEIIEHHNNQQSHNFKDLQKPFSIGATQFNVEDDEFIENYEQLYKKVIRATVKQQTQEEKQKRIQQNKIYFDFTKPIEEEPDYLREIHQIEDLEKPKKRKKNILNMLKLKDIFTGAIQFKQFSKQSEIQKAPQNYDPYHRIRNIKDFFLNQKKNEAQSIELKPKHRIHSIQQRTDILGSQKLANKFRSATSTNSFIKGNLQKDSQLKAYFVDKKKNVRYIDYVDQLQGRKIACQTEYLNYEQAQTERQQFQKMYKAQKQQKRKQKHTLPNENSHLNLEATKLPKELERALQKAAKQKVQEDGKITIHRTIKSWRPQKLLCTRFGCLIPYKIEENKQKRESQQQYF